MSLILRPIKVFSNIYVSPWVTRGWAKVGYMDRGRLAGDIIWLELRLSNPHWKRLLGVLAEHKLVKSKVQRLIHLRYLRERHFAWKITEERLEKALRAFNKDPDIKEDRISLILEKSRVRLVEVPKDLPKPYS